MSFPETLKIELRRRCDMRCCLCHSIGVEIHHIIPECENGPDTEDNAAPLCPSCHETYGANPVKRKFIREARDNWLMACEKHNSAFVTIANELKNLKQEVIASLRSNDPPPQIKNEKRGWPLGRILAFIFDLEVDEAKVTNREVEALYNLFWGHDCEKDDFDVIKNEFSNVFGREASKRICRYALHHFQYSFRDGFTDEDFNYLMDRMYYAMILILDHEEVARGDVKFEIEATSEDNLWVRLNDESRILLKNRKSEKKTDNSETQSFLFDK